PFPEEGDEVLADLLVGEAVEVGREKRHSLPIDDVTQVVVFAGRENRREVGRMSLETPGVLPPPSSFADILNLTSICADAGSAESGVNQQTSTDAVTPARTAALKELSALVRHTQPVAIGLRAPGIDPETVTAAELVTGVLSVFGYTITPGIGEG